MDPFSFLARMSLAEAAAQIPEAFKPALLVGLDGWMAVCVISFREQLRQDRCRVVKISLVALDERKSINIADYRASISSAQDVKATDVLLEALDLGGTYALRRAVTTKSPGTT